MRFLKNCSEIGQFLIGRGHKGQKELMVMRKYQENENYTLYRGCQWYHQCSTYHKNVKCSWNRHNSDMCGT
jgi:hypothetical protein